MSFSWFQISFFVLIFCVMRQQTILHYAALTNPLEFGSSGPCHFTLTYSTLSRDLSEKKTIARYKVVSCRGENQC